jgi:hypothetical protein
MNHSKCRLVKFGTGLVRKHIYSSCVKYVFESTIIKMVIVGNIGVVFNRFNTEYVLSNKFLR